MYVELMRAMLLLNGACCTEYGWGCENIFAFIQCYSAVFVVFSNTFSKKYKGN